MKNILYIYCLCLTFISLGCLDDNSPDIVQSACDISLPNAKLNNTSLAAIPFDGKKSIVFRDSFGHETYVFISSKNRYTNLSQTILHKYNVNLPGDTIRYCYSPDVIRYELNSIELSFKMNVELATRPYYADLTSGFNADILDIYINNPLNNLEYRQIFNKVVDKRMIPVDESINTQKDEITIFDKVFKNVEKTDFANSPYALWYNSEVGIVSFVDHQGVKWRFVRFE